MTIKKMVEVVLLIILEERVSTKYIWYNLSLLFSRKWHRNFLLKWFGSGCCVIDLIACLISGATDNAQPDDGTGSHGWCSVALEWMHTHLLGVRDDYGADQIIVQPDDGSGTLPTLNGLSYTPHGPVAVRWSIDTNIFEVDVPSWNTLVLPPRSCSGKLQLEQQPEGSQANPHGNGFLVNGDGTFQFRCC